MKKKEERYRKANKRVQKALKKAKEGWIDTQCKVIDACLNKNNNKKAYQLVKDLTSENQGRYKTIKDKSGKCLTEEQEILSSWIEYCSELYNYESYGDNTVLNSSQHQEEDLQPTLREKVEIPVAALKKGKSAEVDNIPAELVQAGGEPMIDVLTKIYDKIWKTGELPTSLTQSLIITLPKKGILQLCQNYQTISLISHPSKVMLRVILNRLKPKGPSFFLFYINDIVRFLNCNVRLFADDTSLYVVVENPAAAANILNDDLINVHNWADQWLVSFNPSKTESMVISRKCNKPLHPRLLMDNTVVKEVDKHKHLGIVFSNDMLIY